MVKCYFCGFDYGAGWTCPRCDKMVRDHHKIREKATDEFMEAFVDLTRDEIRERIEKLRRFEEESRKVVIEVQ